MLRYQRDAPIHPPATIVQRLWNYCNVLRDDGVSHGDYVDQRRWQSALKRAFEGRLVAQEGSDEPANRAGGPRPYVAHGGL